MTPRAPRNVAGVLEVIEPANLLPPAKSRPHLPEKGSFGVEGVAAEAWTALGPNTEETQLKEKTRTILLALTAVALATSASADQLNMSAREAMDVLLDGGDEGLHRVLAQTVGAAGFLSDPACFGADPACECHRNVTKSDHWAHGVFIDELAAVLADSSVNFPNRRLSQVTSIAALRACEQP